MSSSMSMTSSMSMGSMTMTSAAMSTSTGMSMGGMGMGGMGDGNACKISVSFGFFTENSFTLAYHYQMLWNWYTIDACFLSTSWHITSRGMFAGSCIGVILLVVTLEALRRLSREYDQYILRNHRVQAVATTASGHSSDDDGTKDTNTRVSPTATPFTPNVMQQAIRSFIHMLQFAVAYIVMLLAM